MNETNKIDDGGPAFPRPISTDDHLHPCNFYYEQDGMSLRDWFAGQALRARWGDGTAMTPEDAAHMAYQLADAMLTARKGGSDD